MLLPHIDLVDLAAYEKDQLLHLCTGPAGPAFMMTGAERVVTKTF